MRFPTNKSVSRRRFLATASAAGLGCIAAGNLSAGSPESKKKALIAITMDMEMSMHYPKWDDMEWNYMKGNLDEATKRYTVEACRRIKEKNGIAHLFVLGQTFEQENVDWLKEIHGQGHRLGNHTYDHVNVWTKNTQVLQHRFQRAPWLIQGKTASEVIEENIRMSAAAMKTRLGIAPVGFRTPGGNPNGLLGREDVQKMLLKLGYTWISSMAKVVKVAEENPGDADFQAVADAQKASQPFVYPTGLVEVPMSPIGDVAAFRRKEKKWKIGDFLKMIERCLQWTIENRAAFDLLTHPAIMQWEDPKFRAYELVCNMVAQSGGKAELVGLDAIARRSGDE
jgi:peptidoglycan/xylan/chitin deacetylase (PgdA/CDA1 family)